MAKFGLGCMFPFYCNDSQHGAIDISWNQSTDIKYSANEPFY